MRVLSIGIAFSVAGLGLLTISSNAQAVNLVTNGSFELNGGVGELGYNTAVTDWMV